MSSVAPEPLGGLDLDGIGWVIAGGESGPGYRVPDPAWFRTLRDQCAARAVPFFFKLLCTKRWPAFTVGLLA